MLEQSRVDAGGAPQERQSGAQRRIESIDVLRGIVMILMALDHVRDFFGTPDNPTNVVRASAALFFTRWITHLCAPTFFLLTGVGAFLLGRRRTTGELSRFLVTRGIWLIVLELTVVRCLGYQFNFDYHVTMLVILWALGWSMIVLGVLVHLPIAIVTAIGVVMIAAHNLVGPIPVLHAQGILVNEPSFVVFVAYPLVPWIGVTATGYGFGQIFTWPIERRRAFLLSLGVALIIAFVALRFTNIYGDPFRWVTQASAVRTLLSFLNTTKYPPSLLYLLMTLGPAALMLRALEGGTPRWLQPALTFGRVPLFYFVLHLTLIHLVAVLVCWAQYGETHWMFESARLDQYPFARPPGWGYSLPVVYTVWIGVVLTLYPLSAWFAAVKARRPDSWLSYF